MDRIDKMKTLVSLILKNEDKSKKLTMVQAMQLEELLLPYCDIGEAYPSYELQMSREAI